MTYNDCVVMDWARVDKTETCWLWTGSVQSRGYGQLRSGGKMRLAHRVAYEELVGPIPGGQVIDHICSTKRCVNPDHLQVVSRARNTQLAWERDEHRELPTHCKREHEFTPENTYLNGGRRFCRTCGNQRTAAWKRKQRAVR